MTTEKTFFSYSRADSAFVIKLAKDLREAGGNIWLDQLDIPAGTHWDLEIEKALKAANAMIAVLSPESIASQNFMDEVSYALEENKKVIPVLLKNCQTPFRLRRLQRIDFTTDYNAGFNHLLNTMNLKMGVVEKNEIDEQKKQKENSLWEEANKSNTIAAYQKYLNTSESGEHNREAQQRIKHMKELAEPPGDEYSPPFLEESSRGGIQKKHILIIAGLVLVAVAAWLIFQKTSGKKDDVRDDKEDNGDQQAWNIALEKNDTSAYYAYRANFPGGQYVHLAQQKIDSLRKETQLSSGNTEDEEAWNAALSANTTISYRDYIKKHPEGKYVKDAQKNITTLLDDQDESAWNTAVQTNTIAAYQNYRKKYPNGKHSNEALENIKSLINQQDEMAWNAAVIANTIKSFQEYQLNYPKGIHYDDASRKIKLLRPKISIGQHYQGGIVFFIDKAGEHGLIAAGKDLVRGGKTISPQYWTWVDAVKEISNYREGGYFDWRLPFKEELNLLWGQLNSVGGFSAGEYWSATEYREGYAWYQHFNSGSQGAAPKAHGTGIKNASFRVRPIRSF